MSIHKKDQKAILRKLGISALNQMQKDAHATILSNSEVVLLSPTGTGKTLAFLLPIIDELVVSSAQVQALIIVPSRELAIQIEQVAREMGSGFKINAIYGGRSGFKDKVDLKHPPAILIGTPGRITDHLRRENFSVEGIKTLVLDEFDKSLETGFENEMKKILRALPDLNKKILTSATQKLEIPEFVKIRHPKYLNYLDENQNLLTTKIVVSHARDKRETLKNLLGHLGNARGIVFCNLKDTIASVSSFLKKKNFNHATFFGGLEQIDRERALIKFRNKTHRFLIATDLAARGIDVSALDYIIHYDVPYKKDEFIHRNGRTARMQKNGTAYVIKEANKPLPSFINDSEIEEIPFDKDPQPQKWATLYISGGRKAKISKGDIAGLFFKQGGLKNSELGMIELKQDCAYVAVPISKTHILIKKLNNSRLKQKKVRISVVL